MAIEENIFTWEWIETQPHLENLVGELKRTRTIGVDLEADSLYHYFEKVCLLQIATDSASYVLDPLVLKDLSLLQPVFSDPRIRKNFHGADYDIRCLYRGFQIEVVNLFDTQMACRFLGLAETGLEAVLRHRFQVELNKKFQRADWSKRPLSRAMVEYAALDGRYLVALAGQLEKELAAMHRLEWVEEESAALTQVRFSPPENNPRYLKAKGASALEPKNLTVLEALLQFRDEVARKVDRPPFKVLGNEVLLDLARELPGDMEALEKMKSLSRKQFDRFGAGLIDAVQQALTIPPAEWLRFPHHKKTFRSQSQQQRITSLKKWREGRAQELALEPGLLLSTAMIGALAQKNPRCLSEMEDLPGLRRWQQRDFGTEILAALGSGI
jgi:ribonuclease D